MLRTALLTASAVEMVLAVLCLEMKIPMPGCPSPRWYCVASLYVSTTVATSRRYTGPAFVETIGMFLRSAGDGAWLLRRIVQCVPASVTVPVGRLRLSADRAVVTCRMLRP